MEIVIVLVVLLVLAALAFAVLTRRRAPGAGTGRFGAPRPPRVDRERVPRDDPMAEAVVAHSQAMEPHEVAAAEANLRAQANRIAAAAQERDAAALGGDDESRLQADGHLDAAAQHRATADELAQRADRRNGRIR
jgi:hypothetical protein